MAHTEEKVNGIITDIRQYWNDAPKGKYMPF